MLFRQAKLASRAEHAVRIDATQLGLADRVPGREPRTLERERRLHAGAYVRRAADDLQERRAAARDLADGQLVGVRMALDREHFAHDDALEITGGRLDRLDLESAHREPRRERRGIASGIHPFAEPGEADAHVQPRLNCARKRRSFSKNMRRSLTA